MHSTTLFTILSTLLLISGSTEALPTRRFSSRRTTVKSVRSIISSTSSQQIPLNQFEDQSTTNLNRIASGSALANYTTRTAYGTIRSTKVNDEEVAAAVVEEVQNIVRRAVGTVGSVPHITLLSGSGMKVRGEVL